VSNVSDVRSIPVDPVVLNEGDEMPVSAVGPLTRTDFVRYAGAGGDLNPIHHDEPFARSVGLPTVFAMGMLHAGMLGSRLARWVGPLNLRTFSVRFTGQVWPGDELVFHGRVIDVKHFDGERRADLELSVTRDGEHVIRGQASAAVADESPSAHFGQADFPEADRRV
jgi:acyl dehydratase